MPDEKEIKEVEQNEKAMLIGMEESPVPFRITSFAELDAMNEAKEVVEGMQETTVQFAEMSENIFLNDEIEDKPAALQALASEFAERISKPIEKEKKQPLTDMVVNVYESVKSKIAPKSETKEVEPFTVWHNKETGQYRWFAMYSNKFRDNDNPPEIISDASHRNFVKEVEAGNVDYPELWLWHVKESRVGKADWLTYTDEGFALASGYFDDGFENVAKGLIEYDGELKTSHGMPRSTIERSEDDSTVIVKHVTREISPLPGAIAANQLTNFEFISKEEGMAIPDNKKGFLQEVGLTSDQIEAIDGKVKETAEVAEAEGLESKEVNQEDIVKAIELMITPLVEKVQALEQEVKGLKQDDDAKIKDVLKETPKSSLEALAAKSIESLFSKTNEVDGRKSLAKNGPVETKQVEESGLFFQEWMQEA